MSQQTTLLAMNSEDKVNCFGMPDSTVSRAFIGASYYCATHSVVMTLLLNYCFNATVTKVHINTLV